MTCSQLLPLFDEVDPLVLAELSDDLILAITDDDQGSRDVG
jgi:hypothetical protein